MRFKRASTTQPSDMAIRAAGLLEHESRIGWFPANAAMLYSTCPGWSSAILSAMRARSGSDFAFILRMTRPRCAFTVISLMPRSPATCLFILPFTTFEETIKAHLKNIFEKLDVGDRTHAVAVAAKRGIIEL